MGTLKTLLLVVLLGFGSLVQAQTDDDIMQMSMAELETDRQAIVTSSMQLDEATSKKFWPVYHAYRADIEPLKQRFLAIVKDYANHHESLSDDKAASLIKDYMTAEADRLKIQKKHVPKIRKAVGAVLTMRFLQIENKLDAIVNFGIAEQIPLAE